MRVVLEYLDIRPGERVLDCGCGLGWFTHVLRELHDCRLAATDTDLPRLRRGAAGDRARDVSIAAADILALPYRRRLLRQDRPVRGARARPGRRGALSEVRRVMKPGAPRRDHRAARRLSAALGSRSTGRASASAASRSARASSAGSGRTTCASTAARSSWTSSGGAASPVETRQHVHHCFPFAHNLVYGVGMRLVQSGCSRRRTGSATTVRRRRRGVRSRSAGAFSARSTVATIRSPTRARRPSF